MFKIFGCLILLLVLVPVLLLGGVVMRVWSFLTGNKGGASRYQNHGQNTQGSQGSQSSQSDNAYSSGSARQGANPRQRKIFKDNEGEYVDFEEVQ